MWRPRPRTAHGTSRGHRDDARRGHALRRRNAAYRTLRAREIREEPTETDRILLDAAAAGASLDDLATIAACAIEKRRRQQPDPDDQDDAFEDRYVKAGTTFGGAGVIQGNLTPECVAAVRAVLEALGKKEGPEDDRTEEKCFHDALQLACPPLPRALSHRRTGTIPRA